MADIAFRPFLYVPAGVAAISSHPSSVFQLDLQLALVRRQDDGVDEPSLSLRGFGAQLHRGSNPPRNEAITGRN